MYDVKKVSLDAQRYLNIVYNMVVENMNATCEICGFPYNAELNKHIINETELIKLTIN